MNYNSTAYQYPGYGYYQSTQYGYQYPQQMVPVYMIPACANLQSSQIRDSSINYRNQRSYESQQQTVVFKEDENLVEKLKELELEIEEKQLEFERQQGELQRTIDDYKGRLKIEKTSLAECDTIRQNLQVQFNEYKREQTKKANDIERLTQKLHELQGERKMLQIEVNHLREDLTHEGILQQETLKKDELIKLLETRLSETERNLKQLKSNAAIQDGSLQQQQHQFHNSRLQQSPNVVIQPPVYIQQQQGQYS